LYTRRIVIFFFQLKYNYSSYLSFILFSIYYTILCTMTGTYFFSHRIFDVVEYDEQISFLYLFSDLKINKTTSTRSYYNTFQFKRKSCLTTWTYLKKKLWVWTWKNLYPSFKHSTQASLINLSQLKVYSLFCFHFGTF
jgi:hypothetical protein